MGERIAVDVAYRTARLRAAAWARGLTPEQAATPVPALPGWSVKDTFAHLAGLAADVVAGLSARPRRLPSKYFYDARGSELFEQITRQPEYYPTRVEIALMEARMGGIAAALGPALHVVEYGSGSGRKTEILLAGLEDVVAYTPIEISRDALLHSVARLEGVFADIEMLPVCADFTRPVALPVPGREAHRRLAFFPGSTLGNFERDEAVRLLRAMRDTVGDGGQALIGIDLDKDPAVIEAAYNDAAGITAEFTLNLLVRLNTGSMPAKDFQQMLLAEVRNEYNHNVSQQLYISEEVWELIKNAKEDLIVSINDAASEVGDEASSLDLSKKIFEKTMNKAVDPLSHALSELKREVQRIF